MTTTAPKPRKPHPYTGHWEAVPLGQWMTAGEIAQLVGVTSQRVTNRFVKGACPVDYMVRRTPAANLYMRIK